MIPFLFFPLANFRLLSLQGIFSDTKLKCKMDSGHYTMYSALSGIETFRCSSPSFLAQQLDEDCPVAR